MRKGSWFAGGGLLVLVGLAAACGGGGGGYSSASTPAAPSGGAAPPAGSTAIAITANNGAQSFNPNPASVRVGSAVVWQNRDGVTHHVVQDSAGAGEPGSGGYDGTAPPSTDGFDAGVTAPGATSAAFSPNSAGVIRYHCTIHPGMVGTLTVTP